MNNYNQDADMMPASQYGGRGGHRGRGRGYQSFDSPFGGPSPQRGRGGGWRSNQQHYYNRGGGGGGARGENRGNFRPRGGHQRGRGGDGGWRGRGGGCRGFHHQQGQTRPARDYVLPAMTQNPWAELEKQYEAEKAAKQQTLAV